MSSFIISAYLFFSFTTTNTYLSYHELMNQAKDAAYEKEYEKADSLFQESVKKVEIPFMKDYVFATNNAIELEDFDKAFVYLKRAFQLGFSKEKLTKKTWFPKIEKQAKWLSLEQEYSLLREKYESQFDTELRQEILEIYQRDQDFRLNGGEDFDADNLERLKKIVKEQGYPGYHQIGQDIDLNIVFHHFLPEDNEQFFYEALKEAVLNGNILPYDYAAIIDYDKIKSQKPVMYGTYFMSIDGVRYLQSNDDFELLNERRKEIGFEPIEQSMKIFNMVFDPNLIQF